MFVVPVCVMRIGARQIVEECLSLGEISHDAAQADVVVGVRIGVTSGVGIWTGVTDAVGSSRGRSAISAAALPLNDDRRRGRFGGATALVHQVGDMICTAMF